MEHILRLLRARTPATTVALHVKSANRAACAFYDRLGFQRDPVELGNHYHLHGEYWDACKYTRSLRTPLELFFRDFSEACALL